MRAGTYILGISAFYHDSAACLLKDGQIIAAVQEERFSRKKHDARFPAQAIRYCLDAAGIALEDVQYVTFYEKPWLKFDRLLETYIAFAPHGFSSFKIAIPLWLKDKLFQKKHLRTELKKIGHFTGPLLFAEHHQSHAASAFFASPFERAAVLTLDGVGEWATATAGIGEGNQLHIQKEMHFPHSLGLLYAAFTYYLGFKVNSGEYKLMGLAPYGTPSYRQSILTEMMDLKEDGSFWLNMRYFSYPTGLCMTNTRFERLFGTPKRLPNEPLTQAHMDIAASIQSVLEEIVVRLTRALAKESGLTSLCMAGGVALNCVSNSAILRDGRFKQIWIQPAAGDSGGALGAALATHYQYLHQPRHITLPDAMKGAYLGPEFSEAEIAARLQQRGAVFEITTEEQCYAAVIDGLLQGKVAGWFQGRMEFGPRALGNRSILADPRHPLMQQRLNQDVKLREHFRPFAPSVLQEDAHYWFSGICDSPYMLFTADIHSDKRIPLCQEDAALQGIDRLHLVRSQIPAVTHVDYSARLHTVDAKRNPRFHSLLSAFKQRTGCPVLLNTSFNVRGEPIVCTPEDAFRCMMSTGLDLLAIGNVMVYKERQPAHLHSITTPFDLD